MGLCKKEKDGSDDPDCLALIRTLQRVPDAKGTSKETRGELLDAARRYKADDFNINVQLMHGIPGGKMGNFRPLTYVQIDLNARNASDIALAGWHEMQHFRFWQRGVYDYDIQHMIIYPKEMRLYDGLSQAGRAEAVRTKEILMSQGYWR